MTKLNSKLIFIVLLACLWITTSLSTHAQFWSNDEPELLPEDQAFSVTAAIRDNLLKVNWSIATDYYMYRDNFRIEVLSEDVSIGDIVFPQGVIENDEAFGEVEVYFYNAELSASLDQTQSSSPDVQVKLLGQGCNKPVGVCYPPMERIVHVTNNGANAANITPDDISNADTNNDSTNNLTTDKIDIMAADGDKSFFAYVITAFGAGILLSFTPCVLPMIPILAGVIAGQQSPSRMRSGVLAICYVAGTVVTYLIAGALAGATGAQLQAYFQNIWVIGFICGLLLMLASSLFGWFKIQLPSSIQSKLNNTQVSSKSAGFSSFALGLISALVVGACVSPVLILALGAAITKGDPVLGAAIMGAMASGMGLLLILFGFGAGWILPKAGAWMNQVQILFGLMVLGVAIYLLDTLGLFTVLYLWSALLLVTGSYLWQLFKDDNSSLIMSGFRAISIAVCAWGLMALVGASLNNQNILSPLENLSTRSAEPHTTEKVVFNHVTSLAEVEKLLTQAKNNQQPVFIDFYADWCLDCKRMQSSTYQEPSVAKALENWMSIEIDVTETSDISEEVKRYFNVFGPPATLLIRPDGIEFQGLRQYGYMNEDTFLNLISRAEGSL